MGILGGGGRPRAAVVGLLGAIAESSLPATVTAMTVTAMTVTLTVTAMTMTAAPASAATAEPGAASLSDVQITKSGLSAVLTAPSAGGAQIDPASVKATIDGAAAPASVQAVVRERRVATLLVDTSGTMGVAGMQTVVGAVDAFLGSVPDDVYVGAVAFSTVSKVVAAPTLDRATLRTAIAGLESSGETSLYDGIASALAQLGASGERSFVLVSDGGDTRSKRTLAQTFADLSSSGVRAQVVGFKTDAAQSSVLTSLSVAGHGSVTAAGSPAAVANAFAAAAQSFGSQIRVLVTVLPTARGIRPLVVSANAGGKAFQGTTVVNLAVRSSARSASPLPSPAPAAGVAKSPAAATANGPLGLPWLLLVALLIVFVGLAGVVVAVMSPTYVSRRQRRIQSIESYLDDKKPSAADERSAVAAISSSLIQMGDKVMEGRASTPKTQRLLERADLALRPGEWAVLRVVAVVVGLVGGMFLMRGGSLSSFFGALLGFLVGLIGPAVFLKLAAKRRSKKFEDQLPDVLTLVASSLATGFSLLQALDAVASDASEPAAKEFSRALAETRIGADLNTSLDRLADRMDSDNLRWTGMAIDIQRQVGGNLAETLRSTATTLRDRQALGRHVKALSAEGRMSAYILIALPVGIFLFMLSSNREYISLLWTNMIGIGMLTAGLISLSIGVFWMNKVVTVEV